MYQKCICIKDKEFDYQSKNGGFVFKVYKGKTYDYNIIDSMYNVTDNQRTYYPILSIFFNEIFVDLIEYRNNKIEELGIE